MITIPLLEEITLAMVGRCHQLWYFHLAILEIGLGLSIHLLLKVLMVGKNNQIIRQIHENKGRKKEKLTKYATFSLLNLPLSASIKLSSE